MTTYGHSDPSVWGTERASGPHIVADCRFTEKDGPSWVLVLAKRGEA